MSFACPAAWRRACPHPSLTVSFCFSSFRLVSRLVLRCPASRGRVVLARLIVIILLVGRGSWCRDCSFRLLSRRAERLFPSRRFVSFLVSGSGEALVSRFIPTVSGGAAVLVSSVSGLGRCLLVLMPSGGGGAMPFSSSTFPPVSYHPMATWYGFRAVSFIWLIVVCFVFPGLLLSSRFACPVRDDGTGGGAAGCLFGYRRAAHHASSIDIYNEYDVCDVYKRYKDTRIRGYDGYIG